MWGTGIEVFLFKMIAWDDIFKLLRGPGINSKESIIPAYIAGWQAGKKTLFLLSPHRLF
jgi:hypothetical protein